MDFDMADLALKSASFIMSIGAVIYAFFATRRKDVDERLDRMDARIARLEASLANVPDKDDFNQLLVAMTGLRGEVKAMSAELSGTRDLVVRLERKTDIHQEAMMKSGK